MKKNKNSKGLHGQPEQLRDEWKRLYDHSNNTNISNGAAQANTTQTVAHGDQWRGQNKNHKKAK